MNQDPKLHTLHLFVCLLRNWVSWLVDCFTFWICLFGVELVSLSPVFTWQTGGDCPYCQIHTGIESLICSQFQFQIPRLKGFLGSDGLAWMEWLYWFPVIATVTYRTISWLKTNDIILCGLEVWHGSPWAKIQASAGLQSFLEGLRKNPISWTSLASRDYSHPLTHGPHLLSSKAAMLHLLDCPSLRSIGFQNQGSLHHPLLPAFTCALFWTEEKDLLIS